MELWFAHGNNTRWLLALYIYEDKLHFAVAQIEKLHIISSKKKTFLSEQLFTI